MSWWWVSSRPSPRSQSSVPWRWQTSPSSPRSTDGCGSWRWRSCSGCWPECRELPVETLHPPGSRTTCSCHACPAGFALINWFLTNGKKLCRRTEQQQQQQHNLRGCQACDREAWCKSDKDSDTRKQYLHCDVWRLNNTSYFPCGSCSYRSGAAGLTAGCINVFIPSCLQRFASGQSLTHNENTSYPAKDIISPTTVLKGPVHNKLSKHFPLFCCAIWQRKKKEDLNSSVSFQKLWSGYVFFPRQHAEGNMFVMSMNLVTRKENWKRLRTTSVDDL